MTRHRWILRLVRAGTAVFIAVGWSHIGTFAQRAPSALASGAFRGEGGFSFRVEFADSEIIFKRTVPDLPQKGEGMPAWLGEAYVLFRVSPGQRTKKISVQKNAWDHQIATYNVSGGGARVVLSRLTPAVLIDSPARSVAFHRRGPVYVAFISGGKVIAGSVGDLGGSVKLDEPWVLGWFGGSSPYRNYLDVADLDDEHVGADKVALSKRRPVRLDLPLLFRL